MASHRKNYCAEESGIALATALVIVAASLMLLAGVFYLIGGGLRIATMNKQFSNVQEAAAGGAEQASEVVRRIDAESSSGDLAALGVQDAAAFSTMVDTCSPNPQLIRVRTGDARYVIDVEVSCLGQKPIPGSNALVFPPPPSFGRGGALPTFYVFLAVKSEAKTTDTVGPTTDRVARVEAVYRFSR